jgi:hypothetical protein
LYEKTGKSINKTDEGVMMFDKIEDKVSPTQIQQEYKEAVDIFPALHKYINNHNTDNLQKLCTEIAEFCKAVYVSTRNDEERKIYYRFVAKLNK